MQPATAPLPKYVTITQVAAMLSLTTRGLRKMIARGAFPQPLRLGRAVRWALADVQTFLSRRQAASESRSIERTEGMA